MMLVYLPVTLLCVAVAGLCLRDILRERLAPRLRPGVAPGHAPALSVLIPARDEAAGIGACLDGLAAQRYPRFEVVVVDDNSTDGTGERARSYAGRLPGLRVLAGQPLPAGWAGKCFACWQAAERATGEWLLFLDADVRPEPGLLAALAQRAADTGADAITLMPLVRLGSLAEKLLLPAFGTILYGLYPLAEVSAGRVSFLNGQCVFIRRAAYEAIGGHKAVRASVLEDVELGQRAAAAGFRIHAAAAPELLSVRMYAGWRSAAEGLGKNAVAGYRSGGRRSAWVGARQALIALAPLYLLLAALFAARPLAVVLGLHGLALALLAWGSAGWIMRRRYAISPAWGLGYPLGLAIYYGLALRSLIRIRRGRGVVWKGRTLERSGRPIGDGR